MLKKARENRAKISDLEKRPNALTKSADARRKSPSEPKLPVKLARNDPLVNQRCEIAFVNPLGVMAGTLNRIKPFLVSSGFTLHPFVAFLGNADGRSHTLGLGQLLTPFLAALIGTHFKFPTDPGTVFVDGTQESIAIQGRAPPILQAQHGLPAKFVKSDMPFGHTRVGNDHDFQAAATRLTVRTGNLWRGYIFNRDCHNWIKTRENGSIRGGEFGAP